MRAAVCPAWAAARQIVLALALAVLVSGRAAAAGLPPAYAPIVIQPRGLPERVEFDLTAAVERARREHKRLYVYLGAHDCRFCRRYEAFLARHADALAPHFLRDYLVVDLRGSLSVRADRVFFRIGEASRRYDEFQRWLGDDRERRLLYPNVWLLDATPKPLMQMPSGTGTFETVPEQLDVLRLEF